MKFTRDQKGLQEYLNSPGVLAALHTFADPMADSIRTAKGADVVVDEYTARAKGRFTARHAVSVAIRDPRARTWQVRDGILTKAAASQGLTVRA